MTHHSPTTLNDIFSPYEAGLAALQQKLGEQHPAFQEFLNHDGRLKYNISQARQYGETDTLKNERAQIIAQLHTITLSAVRMSFIALCDQSITRSRLLNWLHNHALPPLAGDVAQRLTECLLACRQFITEIVPLDWSTAFRNRIDKLVAMVQCYETDPARVQALDDILDSIAPLRLVVSRTHLRRLHDIVYAMHFADKDRFRLHSLYVDSLRRSYDTRAGADYHIPDNEDVYRTLSTMLHKLATITKPPEGTPAPLATFVTRLLDKYADAIQPDQKQVLHDWLQHASFAVTTSESVNAYLMIAFLPPSDMWEPEEYTFKVATWFMSDENKKFDNLLEGISDMDTTMTLHPDSSDFGQSFLDMLKRLWKANNSLLESYRCVNKLTIELFLPNKLLVHHALLLSPFLHTEVEVSSDPIFLQPVGLLAPVIVRMRERYEPGRATGAWKQKWNTYTQHQSCTNGKVVVITHIDDVSDRNKLFAKLTGNESKDMCAIVHTSVSPECDRQQHFEMLFLSALNTGFPIVLCPRHPEDNPDLVKREMVKLSKKCSLADLPQVVFDKRKWATQKGKHNHPHNHLTLVWDDPTRPPPNDAFEFKESPT